jgi:flavin reductase (DIM6/NTAB) family NADH-FMN oxidoreductase RutF
MSQTQTLTTSPADTFTDVDADSFRLAMREHAGGVAVVTVGKEDDVTGFTATSVSSLCARPPRLLVCVAQSSNSWQTLQRHPYFGVNLLRHEEHPIANRFAGRDGREGSARFDGARWTTMLTGTPLLADALAVFDCEVTEMLPHCDHAIIVGRVCAARTSTGSLPLVYWRGEYRAFEQDTGNH